jgi:hypothetical protein
MNSKEKMQLLRAWLKEWQITRSMTLAYDICTLLAENLELDNDKA